MKQLIYVVIFLALFLNESACGKISDVLDTPAQVEESAETVAQEDPEETCVGQACADLLAADALHTLLNSIYNQLIAGQLPGIISTSAACTGGFVVLMGQLEISTTGTNTIDLEYNLKGCRQEANDYSLGFTAAVQRRGSFRGSGFVALHHETSAMQLFGLVVTDTSTGIETEMTENNCALSFDIAGDDGSQDQSFSGTMCSRSFSGIR